ncbi:MAG: DUF4185 domain-containing protein [Chloroflexi bacterium]|nr:DUF4185 domain-containing protein [Chloroflexota bacterium]
MPSRILGPLGIAAFLIYFLGLPAVVSARPDPPIPSPTGTPQPRAVVIAARASKVSQLVGDFDNERNQPTDNLTASRYKLDATDLGVPFRHKDRTYVLFGDTIGARGGDAIAFTTDSNADDGLDLEFIRDPSGTYQPIIIPGISQGDYEVPTAGVSVGGRMYVYHTTDAIAGDGWADMGRSVVAVSDDDGQSFTYLYDLSRRYFINVSIEQVDTGLMIFGSGKYRRSNVYLAYQPEVEITTPTSLRYWSGVGETGEPLWSAREDAAQPLFDQPCVGEFSVTYNRFIRKWLMLYNCDSPRGINLRTADQPWGPWSEPQVIFEPWNDKGYCYFMHTNWQFRQCDQVQDRGEENKWGGEYGPYQFADFATGDDTTTTIYFTMSTWNPYTVVLMKARLQ